MNAPAAPSLDSHEVTFTLLERDAWALLRAFDDARPPVGAITAVARWSAVSLPSALLVLIFLTMGLTNVPIRLWQVIFVACVSFVLGASLTWMLPERKLPPLVSDCLALGRQQTIILSREGVRILGGGMSSFVHWTAYSHVGLSNGFLLLFRGDLADFLPVSAFASEEEAHDVAREIAAYIRAAHGNPVEREVACA
jgi:hypothetical protein